MKKLMMIVFMAVFISIPCSSTFAGMGPGPAPHSGDGVPDGSGFESPPSPGPKGK